MTQLDYTDIYLMDIFEKDESDILIKKLDEQLEKSDERPGSITFIGAVERTVKETKYQWQVKDIQKLLDIAEEIGKGGLAGNVSLARDAIKKITLVGVRNDDLPFFVLIMLVEIDKEKVKIENLFVDIATILRPLRLYMEQFNGIARQLFGAKPICPYFVNIGVVDSKKKIDEILRVSQEILDFDGIPIRFHVTKEQLIEKGLQIRNIIPLKNLHWKFNLLSVAAKYSNAISFVGYVDQMAFNGLMTPFFLTFSQDNRQLSGIEMEHFLRIQSRGYDDLMNPWNTAGTLIYLISLYTWVLHLEKLASELESEFINIRKKIFSSPKSNNEVEFEKHITELNLNGIKIAKLTSDIGRATRITSVSLEEFVRGGKTNVIEIPIPPATLSDYYYMWINIKDSLGSGAYLQAMALKISGTIKTLENNLSQYNHENDLLHGSINNMLRLRGEKQNKSTQKWLKITASVTAAATISILILTGFLVSSTDEMTQATITISDLAKKSLIADEERKAIELASLESRYDGFKADLNFRLHSIAPDSPYGYDLGIFNQGTFDTYLKLNMELTAYCDENGGKYSYDHRIFDNEEITIEKENGYEGLTYYLPKDFLDSSKPHFEYRIWVVTHPSTSQGFLESRDDNKHIFIQYSYNEDGKWMPDITSTKGGLDCSREPYGGDVRTLRYTNEDHFLFCSACR